MNLFLDSSALAKRYIEESGSDQVSKLCSRADQLILCVICLPEVISGLQRLQREGKLSKDQYVRLKKALMNDTTDSYICDCTPSVIQTSVQLLERHSLRAMDALHLSAAVEWGVDQFASGDHRQIQAAEEEDLEVITVG